jgi:MoaA/NifB/PqqE/SkfB family radical SAM enzyme
MRKAFRAASALLKVHLLRRRLPLFLSWNITFRCNLRCAYCAACEVDRDELNAEQVMHGLDAVWRAGSRWVTFGGGEPLIREDIGSILKYAKDKGFQVYISTNGILLPRKVEELKFVDHVNLSMDGDRETHDGVRGEGAFDKAMRALEICREQKKDVSLLCVVGRHNVDRVQEVVDIAKSRGVCVMFQPATRWLSTSMKPNPIAPDIDAYRGAIEKIMALKRAGAPIRNSYSGLRHLAKWPDPTPIWCVGARLIAVVEADGSMLACHQCQVGSFLNGEAPKGGLDQVFHSMRPPQGCSQCWCAPLVELSMLFSMKPEAIFNAMKMIK